MDSRNLFGAFILITFLNICTGLESASMYLANRNSDKSGVNHDNLSEESSTSYQSKWSDPEQALDEGDHGGNHSHQSGVSVAGINFEEVKTPTIICIVILFVTLTKLAFHHAKVLSTRFPESCLLIIIGLVLGAILKFSGGSASLPHFFASHEFFLYLLPPIILEASFSLHDRDFFNNIKGVLIYAVIGTTATCFVLGYSLYGLALSGAMGDIDITITEILVFSALICAVDPVAVLSIFEEVGVNNCLYFLVFGESLLNDGVTVVIYKVMQEMNEMDTIDSTQIILGIVAFLVVAAGGLLIGIAVGIICAFLTKFTNSVRVVEPIAVYCFAYLAFLVAEIFELSGIISLIGFGLIQVQYTFFNITEKSKTTIQYFTKVIATTNEIIIFLFIGLALVRPDHSFHVGFILWTLFLTLVVRFIMTYGLTFFINFFDTDRAKPISAEEQFIISYGGLRGAISFSLVSLLHNESDPDDPTGPDNNRMFLTTTLCVVIFTVFIQGITIKPLVNLLKIGLAVEGKPSFYTEMTEQVIDDLMHGTEAIIGFRGQHYVRKNIQRFNDKYMTRWLLKGGETTDDKIFRIYQDICLREHFETLQASGAKRLATSISVQRTLGELYTSHEGQEGSEIQGEADESIDCGMEQEKDNEHIIKIQQESHFHDSDNIKTAGDLRKYFKKSKNVTNVHDKDLTKEDDSHSMHTLLEEKRRRFKRLKTNPCGLKSAMQFGLPRAGSRTTLGLSEEERDQLYSQYRHKFQKQTPNGRPTNTSKAIASRKKSGGEINEGACLDLDESLEYDTKL